MVHPWGPKMDQSKSNQNPGSEQKQTSDSLGIPMKKSPIVIFALLQIPLVIIMVVILYFMYQARQGS
jgi:hypothetical protein